MVFISHKSNPDKGKALEIAEKLEKNGISCWVAQKSIEDGEDFSEEITQAINACELFILLLSRDTLKSPYVRKEIVLAVNHRKMIIPLKLEDFEISDAGEYLLSNVQTRAFSFSDADYEHLISRCKTGERVVEIEVSKNPMRTLTTIKGDFQDNMHYFITNHPKELKNTVFAMGIDCSSRLDISSTKGIVKHVCEFLETEYGISIDVLQQLVNRAKLEQLNHTSEDSAMEFKDIILIRVPLENDEQGENALTLNLLLVANSKKRNTYYISNDVDEVEGIDSREIVIEIFNKLNQFSGEFTNLFVGAIGTNGLSFPYDVITSEIINCFIYSYRCDRMPLNLFYSVRRSDLEKSEITVEKIFAYISSVVKFIKK